MKAEEYLISRDIMPQRPNKWKWIDSPSVNMADALKSVEMARKEEREKAINAFKETNNYLLEEINKGNHLTSENTLSKFKELLNVECRSD